MLVKLHELTWTKDHGKALNIILELNLLNFHMFIHLTLLILSILKILKHFHLVLFSLLLNLLKYQIILQKLTSKKVDCLR
jgi:hypothetical protein